MNYKYIYGLIGTITVILIAIWAINYFALFQDYLNPGEIKPNNKLTETEVQQEIGQTTEVPFTVESIATGLEVPWSIAFTSTERILITERSGRIRVLENGLLTPTPLHTFTEVQSSGEEGLMSIVLSPDYEASKHLYACLAYPNAQKDLVVKVERFIDTGTSMEDRFTIIDNIPAGRFHAGCRLVFGPEDKLFVSTGDGTEKAQAQNLSNLAGKILRLNPDGSVPEDNPFGENNPIWSYGHRNPQGLDFHPESGQLYSSEHGPSIFDGPAGGDEINLISKGGNYGWPLVSHTDTRNGTISPLQVFTPAEAPGSLLVYSGDAFPQFKNHILIGALKGQGILHAQLENTDTAEPTISYSQKLEGIDVGRIRDISEGPDGFIYFTTSNRDGRATAGPQDDQVYRLIPKQ